MLSNEHIGNLKYFVFLICLFDINFMTAQIENISINDEVIINRIYAGVRSNTQYFIQEDSSSTQGTYQLGTQLSIWIVPSILKAKSFIAVVGANNKQAKMFSSYAIQLYPSEHITIQMGVMATPTTKLRPNPTTWQSQIETNAEKSIIGGRPGGKIQFSISEKLKLSYGYFNHDSKAAHHLKLRYDFFKISTFLENSKVFVATRLDVNKFELVMTHGEKISWLSSIIPIKNNYRIFMDMSFDPNMKIDSSQIGVRKYFSNKIFKGLLDLNYNFNSNYLSGGLFLHI